ncbi:hypothetical protein HMPREF1870_02920 [Bacteroidales bacterium KA00344]|nr:hypothetical protein HMPREF1870_02920 [Bacteroidales bacterium KA00344]
MRYLCFALSLQKIGCTWQFESKLSLRSFALSLHKISCTWAATAEAFFLYGLH